MNPLNILNGYAEHYGKSVDKKKHTFGVLFLSNMMGEQAALELALSRFASQI